MVLTPDGPHYGKLICQNCGTFLTWLPRPRNSIDISKLPKLPEDFLLPVLTGASQRQIDFGTRCREQMLARCKVELPGELYDAMRTIADARFWIANSDKPARLIRWPQEWEKQVSQAAEPG